MNETKTSKSTEAGTPLGPDRPCPFCCGYGIAFTLVDGTPVPARKVVAQPLLGGPCAWCYSSAIRDPSPILGGIQDET